MRIFRRLNKLIPLRIRGEDSERIWATTICYAAADEDEAERLYDALHEALGCHGEGDDHECPHFRFSSLEELSE